MIKKAVLGILAVIVFAIAAFCIAAAMQPDNLKISRSATVRVPPEKVFEQINDFRKWGDHAYR